ncbi:hypothetical protein QCA50_011805 [Cerrena zonata]|uniref:Uncharacterized protein n=1 Tax=Cerrena zonata TaxID=2478898 RepID=A0AAW0G7J5_9APHY
MRLSSVFAVAVAVASSVPAFAFAPIDGILRGPHFGSPLIATREPSSSESLVRRAEAEIMKRLTLAQLVRHHPQIARDVTMDLEARDDELAKRFATTPINPALVKFISEHRGTAIARDEELAKRVISSQITPALGKWISEHPNFAIARDEGFDLEARHKKAHGQHGRKKSHGHKKGHKKGSKKLRLPNATKAAKAKTPAPVASKAAAPKVQAQVKGATVSKPHA